ncbi:MAG: sigma-70 family RNA polymerase sigma factor [Nannocystaceae bacterium]|nr:sigma-70 family RNA polymerase sigma factor [Nannocystaceae bacterium]
MDTDRDLLERWRAGEMASGQTLLRRHFRSVYTFFVNKVSGSPDDLIQETFRACVESRGTIRDGSSFRAFLLTIARRELYRSYRTRMQVEEFDPSRVSVSQLLASPTSVLVKEEHQRHLLQSLRLLPVELQLVLELTYWEQLPAAEAAEVLEVPVGTLKSRLRRAREALRELFAEVAQTAGANNTTADDIDRWVESLREELAVRARPSLD